MNTICLKCFSIINLVGGQLVLSLDKKRGLCNLYLVTQRTRGHTPARAPITALTLGDKNGPLDKRMVHITNR